MVSAAEALRAALHEGALEKHRRTGGWKRRHFVLTATHFLHFDSVAAPSARGTLPTAEILRVQRDPNDPLHRNFALVLYRQRKEFRALSSDDRDAWVAALEGVAAFKSPENAAPTDDHSVEGTVAKAAETRVESPAALLLGPGGSVDLARLCEQMKKAFSWQLQVTKSFAAKDVVEFVHKQLPDLPHARVLQIGQDLIDTKLLVPLKSHVFDESDSTGRLKFVDVAAPKPPRNHLAMRAQSISNLMGHADFSARKYAEDFLKKHASDKIDGHCSKLVVQKEQTIEELKEEISANYTSFIDATTEIKRMENSVSQLKLLVLDCKRSLQHLKGVSLAISVEKKETPGYELAEKKADARAKSRALDRFIHDLEVHLHERSYDDFSRLLLEHKHASSSRGASDLASEHQQLRIEQLQQQFVARLVDDFNASMQTSERMHKKEDHLRFLIQLGEAQLATEMCLQNYAVRIALQLRHVPSSGNALNYVINLSRTFFTSLLVCYEDYEQSFRGQKSVHFISLTVWISAQLERFANEIICHIFPQDLRTRSTAPGRSNASSTPNSVAVEVPEFKNVTKFVASALRYVFYGSRQLELAGLPTAHCLAPHLVPGLVAFLGSYSSSIRGTMKEEIKRERWEQARRTIRDTATNRDVEIVLTQSARSFYSMVQQFLRDVQRVLNPSCPTSYLADVHDAVVLEADDLLVQFTVEVKRYLENPKTSSSLRLKQVVGVLTNIAYVHDDCAARATHILHEYLPKAALQNRNVDVENATLWRSIVETGVKRCAQALLMMSIRWQDLDLSEEPLVDLTGAETREVKTIFLQTLMAELEDVSNEQLEKALRRYRKHRHAHEPSESADGASDPDNDDDDENDGEDQVLLATMVLEAMLVEIREDEAWWQLLRKGGKDRRLGYGAVNKLIAELRVVSESVQASKRVETECESVITKLSEVFRYFRPEKKDVQTSSSWVEGYMALCKRQTSSAAGGAGTAT